jgi:hypothetical protein
MLALIIVMMYICANDWMTCSLAELVGGGVGCVGCILLHTALLCRIFSNLSYHARQIKGKRCMHALTHQ